MTAARNPSRTFHVWTIGCQMNVADSENLSRKLLAAGFQETDLERADVAVLNTCCVRQASEDKVYSKLHELRDWKTGDRVIALTGCLGSKEGDNLTKRFPQLDTVLPIGRYEGFISDLEARYDYSQGEPLPAAGRTGVSHYVNVIEGCNHNCTFCIVPRVRGRERSFAIPDLVQRCRADVQEGAREVVLLGQNVDAYRDPEGRGGLAALLREVERIEGLRRVRFMTSHPRDLEPELLEVMAASGVVCRELQLPIQSGDDRVLRRMARGYLVSDYRSIIERARALMPDLGIATDVIVGFPGETEEMYLSTRRVVEEIGFDVVHVAMYSPRPGTHAGDKLVDDVPQEEKKRRINDLLAVQKQIAAGKTVAWLGREIEVLVEGADELGRPYGRSRQGKRVVVKRSLAKPGSVVRVMVEEAFPGQLAGPLTA
ncbi:MAG TPA: MiaB/RimO family radical SAM methylthiotransferase [Candidatus Dormibacteraeota bacterium]|nr:MiaB/RimO family radical SAM methylthiotransferase [Candidatus Dormibacteraeota bacterium]